MHGSMFHICIIRVSTFFLSLSQKENTVNRSRTKSGMKVREGAQTAKDYNRGFGIIRHISPKVAANDLYTYESKLFLRTIDNF